MPVKEHTDAKTLYNRCKVLPSSFPRRLIKSTFFLVALFGLHYILFVFLPVEVSSSVFKIWTLAELALSSTQVTGSHGRPTNRQPPHSPASLSLPIPEGFRGRRALLLHERRGETGSAKVCTLQMCVWGFKCDAPISRCSMSSRGGGGGGG